MPAAHLDADLGHLHGEVGDGAEDGRVIKVEAVVGLEDGVVLVVGRCALGVVDLLAALRLLLLDRDPVLRFPLPNGEDGYRVLGG